MKKQIFRTSARLGAVLAVGALAACSSDGAKRAPSLEEAVRISNLVDADVTRVIGNGINAGMPGTAFNQIPDTGSATYTGPGGVSIFTRQTSGISTVDTSVVEMIGTSSVTYDFATDSFDGSISDMFAVNADGKTSLVLGEVTIANGSQADASARPTYLEANATGTLDAFGEVYEIEVGVEGLMRGTNPSSDIPVKAINLEGFDGTVAGRDLLVDVFTIGDKDRKEGAFLSD